MLATMVRKKALDTNTIVCDSTYMVGNDRCIASRSQASNVFHSRKGYFRLIRVTYRIDEVASMLGLGRTTIYKLIDEGHLRRIKVGSRTLIRASDVDALLQRHAA